MPVAEQLQFINLSPYLMCDAYRHHSFSAFFKHFKYFVDIFFFSQKERKKRQQNRQSTVVVVIQTREKEKKEARVADKFFAYNACNEVNAAVLHCNYVSAIMDAHERIK